MRVSTYSKGDFLRKYEKKVEAHTLVPFKKIIELLKPLKGKRILDVGCGSGELGHELAKLKGTVVGIDKSKKWIAHCEKTYKHSHLSFLHSDASKQLPFKEGVFDAVVMNMVLLNVGTLKEVEAIIKEISRVIKTNGTFIFSDLHPICIMTPIVKPTRYQKYSRNFTYFKDGAEYIAGINIGKEKMEFYNKHWTLETYTNLLQKYGFYIYKISEPTYGKDASKSLREFKIPEYIVFGCKKV